MGAPHGSRGELRRGLELLTFVNEGLCSGVNHQVVDEAVVRATGGDRCHGEGVLLARPPVWVHQVPPIRDSGLPRAGDAGVETLLEARVTLKRKEGRGQAVLGVINNLPIHGDNQVFRGVVELPCAPDEGRSPASAVPWAERTGPGKGSR